MNRIHLYTCSNIELRSILLFDLRSKIGGKLESALIVYLGWMTASKHGNPNATGILGSESLNLRVLRPSKTFLFHFTPPRDYTDAISAKSRSFLVFSSFFPEGYV